MYRLDLYREIETQKVSVLFGNQFIEDNLPRKYPNAGERNHLIEQPSKIHHYIITAAVNQEEQDNLIRDWSENEDPFTQLDLIDIEDNQVQQLIFQIRISTSIPNNERLANRLIVLFNDAKDEDSNSPGVAVGSLRNFYHFLQEYTNLKYPNITLTPDNNIYTSWEDKQDRLFSVHFLPNGITNFVIFKPNDRHPERPIRLSGITTSDILIETVAPNGVNDWILE